MFRDWVRPFCSLRIFPCSTTVSIFIDGAVRSTIASGPMAVCCFITVKCIQCYMHDSMKNPNLCKPNNSVQDQGHVLQTTNAVFQADFLHAYFSWSDILLYCKVLGCLGADCIYIGGPSVVMEYTHTCFTLMYSVPFMYIKCAS